MKLLLLFIVLILKIDKYTGRHWVDVEAHKLVVESFLVAGLDGLIKYLLAQLRVELVEAHEDEAGHTSYLSYLVLHGLREIIAYMLIVLR